MDVAEALESFVGKDMFMALGGEVWDFTLREDVKMKAKKKPVLILANEDVTINYPLPASGEVLRSSMSRLTHFLSGKNILIGWGLKDLFTYHLGKTNFKFSPNRPILDLKVLESYMAYRGESPQTYDEAVERLEKVKRYSRWEQVKSVYANVYYPLMRDVLPAIETQGLVRGKRRFYPYYEIEGQANGRLKGSNYFSLGFNPHSLSREDFHRYDLGDFDDLICMIFDYSSLEVRVLQWLSGDPELRKVLETGEDVYKIIWERITNVKCKPAFREVCKSIFLPIMYGLGPKTLSERLKVSESVVKQLIENICAEFPIAVAWIKDQQNSGNYDGCVYDKFGRRRRFDGNEHRIRNFVVQAPASMICLHKLVRLFYAIKGLAKIVCHIHDGYIVTAHKRMEDKILNICKTTLEAPEELYPGLLLEIAVQTGDRLYKLKPA